MDTVTKFPQIAVRIIQEQEMVIGPLAWSEASKVSGLKVIDKINGQVEFNSTDPKQVIDGLVNQYKRLFGLASQEVCKDAVRSMMVGFAPGDVPISLK